jgi:hypothetical protein
MSVDNEVPESRGVTVEPLASIDIDAEIEAWADASCGCGS